MDDSDLLAKAIRRLKKADRWRFRKRNRSAIQRLQRIQQERADG